MSSAFLLLVLACQAGQVDGAAAPRVRVVEGGGLRQAELVGWEAGVPQLADGPAGDWLALRFPPRGAAAPEAGWQLELAGGGRIPGAPAVTAGGAPAWRVAGLEETQPMPFNTLWLRGLARGEVPDASGERDEIWIRTPGAGADRHRGYLMAWNAEGLAFETEARAWRFAWEDVEALRVYEEEVPVPAGAAWLQLANGGFLSVRPLRLEGGALVAELPWGAAWSVPLEEVRRLRRRDGVTEFADRGWEVVEQPQGTAIDWSPKVGRSVEGRALRIGEDVYPQGVGVRVPTTLARAVNGPGTFFATVGVDRAVRHFRRPEPVVFEVLLDEQSLYRSPPLRVEDGARSVLARVPHAGRLRLVARPAGVLPFGGHADWCDLLWLPAAAAEGP